MVALNWQAVQPAEKSAKAGKSRSTVDFLCSSLDPGWDSLTEG